MNVRNVIAVFLLCTTVAVAQNEPRLWLGGGVGYGIGMFALSGPGTACNFDPACPQYTGGTGGGFLAGLSADWRPWKPFGILARATYFGSHVTMSTSIADAFARDRNGNVVPLVRSHTLDLSVPEFTIDLMGSWRTGRIRLFAGPTASIILSPTWSSQASISSPDNVTYANNLRDTQLLAKQSLTDARSFLIGLTVGIGTDIALSPRWTLAPEASFTFPLQSLRTTSAWKESSVRFLANLRYGMCIPCTMHDVFVDRQHSDTIRLAKPAGPLGAFVKGAAVIDTSEETDDCEHRIIHTIHWSDTLYTSCSSKAELHVAAVERDGTHHDVSKIVEQAHYVTEVFPLLPYVFFEDMAASIPYRYTKLHSRDGFLVDTIDPNSLSIHHELLNIVGARMQQSPNAHLNVQGYADPVLEKGDCFLARLRAEEIKKYLVEVWGIDASRIGNTTAQTNCVASAVTQTHSEKGYADNRHAELTSDDSTLFRPIERKHFIDPGVINPPALEFDPAGSSPCGKAYTIQAMQGSHVVFSQTAIGVPTATTHILTPAEGRTLVGGAPLHCTLRVADENGGDSATSSVDLPVTKDTALSEIQRLSLNLFDVSQDKIREADKQAITAFFLHIDASAPITVTGYTDDIGEREYNLDLSEKRAKSIADFIRATRPEANITRINGIGETQFVPGIVSYATPEERHLSRAVRIEVEVRKTK